VKNNVEDYLRLDLIPQHIFPKITTQ